ncbi:MAG TPA: GGDEF domain-containing protein [Allosphingosinicella sp.]|jgi:diguanylate cyclase (GGDEF)-like protein|nr:GGDEF domain-containing protein [Allosphingosinicella sp.]
MGGSLPESLSDDKGLHRPFPVRWIILIMVVIGVLISCAFVATTIARAEIGDVHWRGGEALRRDIRTYMLAAFAFRAAAFALLAAVAAMLSRWAHRLEAARAAAEAVAAELRGQKKELSALNKRLFDEARIDPLTRLQTRLSLGEDLESLWADAEGEGDHYCAVMCDVDRFKEYNDGYGHVAGDDVLRKVAAALQQGCRAGDRLYRYGGEEFLLLLRAGSTLEALTIADRHRAAVEGLGIDHIANNAGVVTVSMGVAPLWALSCRSATDWIEQADVALYKAKRTGRNCIAVLGEEGSMKAVA